MHGKGKATGLTNEGSVKRGGGGAAIFLMAILSQTCIMTFNKLFVEF